MTRLFIICKCCCFLVESVSTDNVFEGIPIVNAKKPSSSSSMPNQNNSSSQHLSIPKFQPSSELTAPMTKPMPKFSLQHEFSLLNTNIPHIDVEVLDAVKRHAMIRVSANGHVIMHIIYFN